MSSTLRIDPALRRVLVASILALALLAGGASPGVAQELSLDAVNDEASAASGEPKIIDVLNNDSYLEDNSPVISAVGVPANGDAVAGRGGIIYTSDPGFTGNDSFTYTLEDDTAATDTATVNVTVEACAPVGTSMDDGGIVVDEEWVRCSSLDATDVVGDVTPVMNPTGGQQALFTTGTVENSFLPEDGEEVGTENETEYRGAYDVSVLKLDLEVPVSTDCLAFDLSFQTEEYPENIESAFNDGFLAELDGSTWDVEGASITAPDNFAFDGSGNIVSVNSAFFEETRVVTDTGTEYDGSTPLLDARTPITPGAHSLYLSIFDATDGSFDSGAYVDRLRAFDAADGKCFRGARQAPNAANDTLSVDEDDAGSVNVLTNDVDLDLDPLEVTSNTNGTNGTAVCTVDTCTYTPDANYSGTDSFTYRVSDGGGTDTGTVNVTVNPLPDPPSATDDSESINEDEAGDFDVLSNDDDPDGDSVSITSKTNGNNGSVSCASTCTYTPDVDYTGSDSFTYTISDGNGGSDTATVSVTVTPRNDAPVAVGDALSTSEDQAAASEVTTNDTDVDGDAVTITAKTNGTNGSVECSTTTCTYTPDQDFYGSDTFTYTISDGKSGTAIGTVNVSVGGVADAPVAADNTLTTPEDSAGSVNVLANDLDVDNDPLTIQSNTDGVDGSVSCSGNSCTYTPDANAYGPDSFTYTISDGNGGTDTATVNVTVTPVNDAPEATGDVLEIDEDNAGDVAVTTNDGDVDGDVLSITAKTNGTDGSVSCSGGSCTYAPDANAHGPDSFTYTISDGNGGTDTGTVNVTVVSVNDDPQANGDTTTVIRDTAKDVNVLGNDTDVDGDSMTITGKTDGVSGDVSCSQTSCTYTPTAGYVGSDSFTYSVSDSQGGTDTATVSVTVKAPNVAPLADVAPAEGAQIVEGASVSFDGSESSDTDGSVSSYEWSVSDGRSFTGSSPSIPFGDNGTYDVTLEVCDNEGVCDAFTVQVTVDNASPSAAIVSQPSAPLRIDTNTPATNQAGVLGRFTATSSDPAGTNDPATYEWDFGDGTTSGPLSSSTVEHAYKKLGTYTATLTVSDGDGGTVSTESQPIRILPTGKCGKLQKSYWGKPGVSATVTGKTQFWYVKGKTKRAVRGAYIKPGQVVKLQPKPGSRSTFLWVCIKDKRYMRVEKRTKSLPTLKYEYLPESALLRLP